MLSRRSSEASSCLIRFCTGTLSAASVRGVTVPVGARPWRAWKRLTASATTSSIGAGRLVGGEVAGDDQALAQQIVIRPRHADREFGVGRDRRPAAAHREIRIAQRGFLDPLRGAFVEGRLMRQRQRRRRARFRRRGGDGRLGRRGVRGGRRAAGLAGAAAAPAAPVAALWPKAGPAASIVATATIVILRMSDVPGMRRDGADVEIERSSAVRAEPDRVDLIRKCVRQD